MILEVDVTDKRKAAAGARQEKTQGAFSLYRAVLFLLIATGGASCGEGNAPDYTVLEGKAQGTTFRITYNDVQKRDFSAETDSLFRLIDKSMSLWDSASIISRFNKNVPGAAADEHFSAVFQRAQDVAAASEGYFDMTVGALVKTWGFSYKGKTPTPNQRIIDSLLEITGYKKVRLENGRLRKDDPRIEIDLNAIAQGYTVDVIASFLARQGVRNYLVEIGGEVRTAGVNGEGKAWRIGIDKPTDNEQPTERPLQIIVALSGKALATSGSYRKFVVRDGKKYSHAVNPFKGYPIAHNLLSVSVIAGDCATADAYATAFLVMGKDKAMPLARAQGLEAYFISAADNGALVVDMTEGFGQYIQNE